MPATHDSLASAIIKQQESIVGPLAWTEAGKVVGIDVNEKWLKQAEWCKDILEKKRVTFHHHDYMLFDNIDNSPNGFLQYRDLSIPIPRKSFDIVFSSTVVNHMFFPLYAYTLIGMIALK